MKMRKLRSRVQKPGYIDMGARYYHEDPCVQPSLNVSTIKELLGASPRHAWLQHPKLNKELVVDKASRVKDLGSAVHELLAGKGRGIVQVELTDKVTGIKSPAMDYRTNAAQEVRDKAVADGFVPILPRDYVRAQRIADAVRLKCRRVPGMRNTFSHHVGHGEVIAVWRDRAGCWGRTMIDWWGPTDIDLVDVKTTTLGLSDDEISRKIERDGLDIQEAWIRRGIAHLNPELEPRIRFRFILVEQEAPHGCRVVELPRDTVNVAKRKVHIAACQFATCLAHNHWPEYPDEITTIGPPEWADRRWLEREPTIPGVAAALSSLVGPSPAMQRLDESREKFVSTLMAG
jgi:hypothetical protein